MSGTPKRPNEEEEHPISAKRPIDEISGVIRIPFNPASNEYRPPTEPNLDGRMTKIPRTDSRESDKRSSLIPYPLPPPTSRLSLEHSSEPCGVKDVRDSKVETKETKVEKRETHTETKFDPQISNMEMENASKPEDKIDGKEIKSDRKSLGDFRPDSKLEKDTNNLINSLSNVKEIKEAPKALQHSESTGDGLDPWRAPRSGLLNPLESAREILTRERRESLDASEAVGENKIELKGDEKIREKERKRKDEKYRGWGERGRDRHDRHNLHLTNPSSSKLLLRDDKELENYDRERKDIQKDRDLKDREIDLSKKISSNFNERENLHVASDPVDTSTVISEKDHALSDTKKSKEIDAWKMCGRDNKDQKRDRDYHQDVESDRHDKQSKDSNDKEPEGGCAEVDGSREQDREPFGHGIHQRKRMQRQKGTPQPSHREARFRSRSRESEGSQEKNEASSIVYKVGECLQELLKSWKEFKKTQESTEDSLENGPILEIRIPAEHVIATNRQVRAGQLWGTDIYSDDSDLVAVLIHTGYCRPTAIPPPSAIQELRATIRVLPPQACYTSTLRNNVRSRAWSAGISCSFRIEKCCIVKKSGGTIDLEPRLNHISAVEPTLAPLSVERTMTTRSAASNALRQQRMTREVTIQYNLCHEPWMKYSITVVADKGLKKPQYTSARLKKGEVLYLETHSIRYELCFSGEKNICSNVIAPAPESVQDKSTANIADVFRWSHCIKILPQNVMKTIGIPSPIDQVEVLEDNLEWEDLQWSQTGVWVAGKEYPIVRVQFLSKT